MDASWPPACYDNANKSNHAKNIMENSNLLHWLNAMGSFFVDFELVCCWWTATSVCFIRPLDLFAVNVGFIFNKHCSQPGFCVQTDKLPAARKEFQSIFSSFPTQQLRILSLLRLIQMTSQEILNFSEHYSHVRACFTQGNKCFRFFGKRASRNDS